MQTHVPVWSDTADECLHQQRRIGRNSTDHDDAFGIRIPLGGRYTRHSRGHHRRGRQFGGGVRSPDAIQSALTYISEGYFGQSPRTIHSKAAHLMRLLVAEHPFVDGNKRTALNTVVVFYELNDFEFEYEDESIRAILKDFATDADSVEMSTVIAYLREHSSPAEG